MAAAVAAPLCEHPGREWIPAVVAAIHLRISPRRVRQLCIERWHVRERAIKRDGDWFVHYMADPKLIELLELRPHDLAALVEMRASGVLPKHMAVAEQRRLIMLRWQAFQSPHRADQFQRFVASLMESELIPAGERSRLSPRSIRRWRRAFEKGGLAALAPQHCKTGRRRHEAGDAAWGYFEGIVLGGNGIACTTAYVETLGAARKQGNDPAWAWPSASVVRRLYRERIPDAIWTAANKGMRAFDALHVPKARRDRLGVAAGDIYCGDERRLDVMVRTETARGWKAHRNVMVTAWYDVRAGCVVGCVVKSYANTETILASLKQAIRRWGKPRTLLVDWGRDYRRAVGRFKSPRYDLAEFNGSRVGDVLSQLGIEVAMATPYHPQSKPIEAFFRRLKDEFDRLWPSFVGGSPAERHEDRQRDVRHRLHELPTLDDVAALVSRYIEQVNNEPHGGHDTFYYAPAYAMEVLRDGDARMESDSVLDLAFGEWIGPRVVGRDGIQWNNRVWGFGDSRLIGMQGKSVWLNVQPDDVRTVMVCDAERKPLFTIECADRTVSTKRDLENHSRMRQSVRRGASSRVSAARQVFLGTPPQTRLANRATGMRALHGDPPRASEAPRLVTVRPELEAPIRAASVTPHERRLNVVQEADDIPIEHLVDGPLNAPTVAAADAADDGFGDMNSYLGFDDDEFDIEGEGNEQRPA